MNQNCLVGKGTGKRTAPTQPIFILDVQEASQPPSLAGSYWLGKGERGRGVGVEGPERVQKCVHTQAYVCPAQGRRETLCIGSTIQVHPTPFFVREHRIGHCLPSAFRD